MTSSPNLNILEQHVAYVLEGQAIDPNWHQDAEDSAGVLFSARECERIATAAPTEYLAGFYFGRALVLRQFQALTEWGAS